MSGVSHLVGPAITIGSVVRQRCLWCGALILDHDLARIAVIVDADGNAPLPALWEAGSFVEIDGNATYTVPDLESTEVPGERTTPLSCCARLDPEVTR